MATNTRTDPSVQATGSPEPWILIKRGEAAVAGHGKNLADARACVMLMAIGLCMARKLFSANRHFGAWLKGSAYSQLGEADRAALIKIGEHETAAAAFLKNTELVSPRLIWEALRDTLDLPSLHHAKTSPRASTAKRSEAEAGVRAAVGGRLIKQSPAAAAIEEAEIRNVERHANFMPADAMPPAKSIPPPKLDPESWRVATTDERAAFLRGISSASVLETMPESWFPDVRAWVRAAPRHHGSADEDLAIPGFLQREPPRRLN